MNHEYPHMTPSAVAHIEGFIKNFVEKSKQPRWRSVLAMKPSKWTGASADDCTQPPAAAPNSPLEKTVHSNGLEAVLDEPAVVFAIGHGAADGATDASLRWALFDDSAPLESVISIRAGSLAVVFGHSNEVRVCRR